MTTGWKMDDDGTPFRFLRKFIPKRGMNWMGFFKDHPCQSAMHCGGHWKDQQPGKDLVLDHIILDLTGGTLPLEQIADASVQRAFQKKKRLLRRSNTVLFSRLAIMALVAIMLVVTTLLTWYYTSTYSARSVNSLASVLRQQLLRNSMQAMVSVLGELYNATLVLSSLHQQVYFATLNQTWESVEPEVRQVNDGVFKAQDQYSSVAFVCQDGRLTDYSRNSLNMEYLLFVNATYGQTRIWYIQNVTGITNETNAPLPQKRDPPYPLSADNLVNVNPKQQVYWTIAPNSFGVPVVSPAIPVKDLITDAFLGLSTITTSFQHLNRYLSTIDLLDGYLYFQRTNGTDSSIIAVSYNDTNDLLLSPEDSSNQIVQAAATFLARTKGHGIPSQNRNESIQVKLLGHEYYIDTMPLAQDPYSLLNLTAVMIVPRKSIMGRIDRRNRTVVGVSVGTAIGVLVLGCCFICFVTRKMSTEMQLRQELIRQLVGKHRAEQSSNYKSQFLANMSHELRTPMAGIIGLLDLLSCDALTPEQEFSVSQIRRCATGLLDLVNNVLDISKVEAGKMELDIAHFSVTDELESLVDMFAAQCVKSRIDFALDLSDNIPDVVRGDPNRIRQIFSNLFSNSVKFTTHGHVMVKGWADQSLLETDRTKTEFSLGLLSRRDKVSGPLHTGTENKLALVFEVDDSGCGIPIELRETVFDSFVQGDSSTTRNHGGSGLGLYIVRSLVELMGGEVVIVPKQGSGTLVRFHIFVEKAHDLCGKAVTEGRPIRSPSPDGLHSVLGSPVSGLEPVKMPPSDVLEKTQVVVAMEEGIARNVAAQWLERTGLQVTCVSVWEDIIPTLENLCKNTATDSKSVKDLISDDSDVVGSHSYSHVQSPETNSSQVSENIRFPSVLALVDVTLHRPLKVSFDSKVLEPSFLEPRDNSLSRSDSEKFPPHMQEILDSMLRIHSQYLIAVGWVVAPDCGSRWKQALQADNSFLVMNKPLHGSRMRRLLSLLSRTGKLEQHHWEAHSYQSSPSASSLRTMVIPLPEGESFISRPTDLRDLSVRNVWNSSGRATYSLQSSIDEGPTYLRTEGVAENLGVGSYLFDGAQHPSMRSPSGKESRFLPSNQKTDPTAKTRGKFELDASFAETGDATGLSEYGNQSLRESSTAELWKGMPRHGKLPAVKSEMLIQENDPAIHGEELLSATSAVSPISGLVTSKSSRKMTVNQRQKNLVEIQDHREELTSPHESLTVPHNVTQRRRSLSAWPPGLPESMNAPPNETRRASLTRWPATSESNQENTVSITEPSPMVPSNPSTFFGSKALSSIHILLVEDTPVLQRLACMMLKKLGAAVTVVGDGLQAVMAVSAALEAPQDVSAYTDAVQLSSFPHFDLILMDCAMPVMDGYNATRAIRAAEESTSRHIPIVALTAHALASDEERCLSVGMDAYLTKPINCKLLVTTIQDLVIKCRV